MYILTYDAMQSGQNKRYHHKSMPHLHSPCCAVLLYTKSHLVDVRSAQKDKNALQGPFSLGKFNLHLRSVYSQGSMERYPPPHH